MSILLGLGVAAGVGLLGGIISGSQEATKQEEQDTWVEKQKSLVEEGYTRQRERLDIQRQQQLEAMDLQMRQRTRAATREESMLRASLAGAGIRGTTAQALRADVGGSLSRDQRTMDTQQEWLEDQYRAELLGMDVSERSHLNQLDAGTLGRPNPWAVGIQSGLQWGQQAYRMAGLFL